MMPQGHAVVGTDAAELGTWLRLQQTPGVGALTARQLLSAFGLPQQIFAASVGDLRQVVSERIALALHAPLSEKDKALLARSLEWVAQPDHHVLTLADTAYPQALLEIPDPPLLLYVKGQASLLHGAALAVVGSRNATTQGMLNAEHFSAALSQVGMTIISGMALGIDTAAHLGALRGSGSTVAVIGTGADLVYPARNRGLAHSIAAQGCIVSEYALGTPAIASNFPRRNRLISGLARGVLVVEAAMQSGSLITARMAAEQGREVFAIPGSIHSPLSKGCHALIRQGAKLVESAEHVLEEFGAFRRVCAQPSAEVAANKSVTTPETLQFLQGMGHDPVSADTLSLRSGLPMAALQARLLELELAGVIEMLPGGLYSRLAIDR
ncbi:DNA-processing protein DprA [Herbaspirillum sp. RTI4]|uniref:DNA-processing protein DprA n=1 Tax=Herbaspirillum sp. RTI4 TaxID=3048640 RepID=UPI002AB34640|nr:DNA-processing protein DprA [Herbaspirillum sp. RTI4]MDY7577428.1 DNA-processing protein DprA [Herbaspirillum sp. RTI4]MEA9981704.1 DNA-processing protein DprA [Herbaspirillum sp. RTI4]